MLEADLWREGTGGTYCGTVGRDGRRDGSAVLY